MRRLVPLIFILLAATAPAQRGRAFVSIEAHVGTSHMVHVGTVASLEPIEAEKPKEGNFPGKPHRVTFRVTETIKGTPANSVDLILTLQHTFNLEYLRDHKIEVMLCGGTPYVDEEAEIGLDGSHYSFRILKPVRHPNGEEKTKWIGDQFNTSLNEGRMFDLDLKVISRRSEILKRARDFAKRHPAPLPYFFLHVPNEFGVKCGYTNAFCGITLPICEESRRIAKQLQRDPRRLLKDVPKSELEWQRKAVLDSLGRFLDHFSKPLL